MHTVQVYTKICVIRNANCCKYIFATKYLPLIVAPLGTWHQHCSAAVDMAAG